MLIDSKKCPLPIQLVSKIMDMSHTLNNMMPGEWLLLEWRVRYNKVNR